MNFLRLIITLFIVVSCSGAKVKSENRIPISFGDQEEHSKKIEIKYKMDYFLWGLVPRNYSLQIDDLFMREGYSSVANLSIRHGWTFADALLTILTLGFYQPQTFTVEGKVNPYRKYNF